MTAKGMPKEQEWNAFHIVGQCTEKKNNKRAKLSVDECISEAAFFLSPKQ